MRGDQQAANSLSEQTGLKLHDFVADGLLCALCSNTYAAAAAFTDFSQFTEVTGGTYAAQTPTRSWTRSGGKSTLQLGNVSWSTDPANPQDVRTAVVYNPVAASNDLITVVDLTADGTTPIDLQTDPLVVNFASSPTLEVE